MKNNNEVGLYTEDEVETIIRISRISSLIITLGFLYNTYNGVKLAKVTNAYNKNLKIQLINSLISVIPAFLAVLVAFNKNDELVQSFNPEN